MARALNRKEFVSVVANTARCVVLGKDSYEIPALNKIRGLVSRRVHSNSTTNKGTKRLYKSEAYKKAKKKTTDYVNMIDKGDLQRDYAIYRDSDGNNCLGLKYDLSIKKILAEQERNGNNQLFLPSKTERDLLLKEAQRFAKRKVKQCLQN